MHPVIETDFIATLAASLLNPSWRILHFNVTRHPTSSWITQQLREAFPYDSGHEYLILDRDAKFGEAVNDAAEVLGLKAIRNFTQKSAA